MPAESAELVPQRVFERREREGETHFLQASRPCQLACQEELVGQFSRDQPQRRRRCPQNRRPAEDAAERVREGVVA